MEAVKEKLSAVGKKLKPDDSAKAITETPRFHKNLTDVSLFSFGGLCAVSLTKLFDEECHNDFKVKALNKILSDLGQPKQTNESMLAILDGEIMESSDEFVDSLLAEDVLKKTRKPLVVDMITLAISDGIYDARMRVLIKHVAWQLKVTWDEVEEIECDLAETIEYSTYVMTDEQTKEKEKKTRSRKIKRYALIGLASVGGGALIGLTGGLAAPFVAAGAGAIIGTAGAAALGSVAGVAIIGSLFGVAGAGLTGYKMKRRVGAIEEFAFEALTLRGSKFDPACTVKQLNITICITGWINKDISDFRYPWSALAESHEQYSLRWESKYLYQLGEAFDMILQTGLSMATTEALKYTILAGIITAIAWPAALISAAGAIDNPWHVCTQRANEAGKQLAEVLLSRQQGNRPVTLIGFSLGARVIFSCLEELCKRKGHEGLIEDVILLGAPVSGDVKHWKPFTKVVAGKIVNGYARADWMLKFLYRTASVTFKVAGLGPVKWDNRRMHNIDLSDIIDGHADYMKNLDVVMKAVGVRTKDELRRTKIEAYNRRQEAIGKNDAQPGSSDESKYDTASSMTASTASESSLIGGSNGSANPGTPKQETVRSLGDELSVNHDVAETMFSGLSVGNVPPVGGTLSTDKPENMDKASGISVPTDKLENADKASGISVSTDKPEIMDTASGISADEVKPVVTEGAEGEIKDFDHQKVGDQESQNQKDKGNGAVHTIKKETIKEGVDEKTRNDEKKRQPTQNTTSQNKGNQSTGKNNSDGKKGNGDKKKQQTSETASHKNNNQSTGKTDRDDSDSCDFTDSNPESDKDEEKK